MYAINRILKIIVGCIVLSVGTVAVVCGYRNPNTTYGEFTKFVMSNYIR